MKYFTRCCLLLGAALLGLCLGLAGVMLVALLIDVLIAAFMR
jgi:hypothetical protein